MARCGCLNHKGGPKVQHASMRAAFDALMERHLAHGPHSIYPCPKKRGVFHVRSDKRVR